MLRTVAPDDGLGVSVFVDLRRDSSLIDKLGLGGKEDDNIDDKITM